MAGTSIPGKCEDCFTCESYSFNFESDSGFSCEDVAQYRDLSQHRDLPQLNTCHERHQQDIYERENVYEATFFTPPREKLPSITALSESFTNLSFTDGTTTSPDWPAKPAPAHLLYPRPPTGYTDAYFIFFEGVMGVGKTTLLKTLARNDMNNVIIFEEAMSYWKTVFSDCHKLIYDVMKMGKHGSFSVSSKLLACQMKFLTPLKSLGRVTAMFSGKETQRSPGRSDVSHWVMFDRHALSACLVFPLVMLKSGMLSFEHFISLVSTFRANEGDIIVLIALDHGEAIRRIKTRKRPEEETISLTYVTRLHWCFVAVYNTWRLLQYFTAREATEVCLDIKTINGLCLSKDICYQKCLEFQTLWNESLLAVLRDIIFPYKSDCTILELCLNVCTQIQKLKFVVSDATKYIGDVRGLWEDISTQILQSRVIKTRPVDWANLKSLAKEFCG
nr:thymidine kinase [Bovine gammaherpesvirus 4]